MRRCARCILSDRTLGISFDEEGVCSFCSREKESTLPVLGEGSLREQEIHREVESFVQAHGRRGAYDCLALVSGGKDSLMAMWLVAEHYGLRTLAVTIDNGFWDEGTIENARRAAKAFGADYRVVRAPVPKEVFASFLRSEHRKAMSVCALCNQVRASFFRTAFELGQNEGIGLLVDGRSKLGALGAEWPGLSSQAEQARSVLRGMKGIAGLLEHMGPSGVAWDGGWFSPWLHMRRHIGETVRFLEERAGWKMPSKSWPLRSSNCRLSLLDGHLCHVHEIPDDPCEHELSMEIRHGETSREEALRLFLHPPDREALAEIAAELGVEVASL
jgi:hypothetical protein